MNSIGASVCLLLLSQAILQITAAPADKSKPARCLAKKKIKCTTEYCQKVKDKNGCYSCACPTNTCANVRCSSGHECAMIKPTKKCVNPPCFATPSCVPTKECPMMKCRSICQPGVGPDGCTFCDCPKNCKHAKCADDESCAMEEVACEKEPCDSQPTCIPKIVCNPIRCTNDCPSNVGPDGCTFCDCSKTCQGTTCAEGETCVMKEVVCKKDPCDPQPTCVPKSACPQYKCQANCVNTYGKDNCPNGCTCPCQTKQCEANEECVLQIVNCFVAPCPPIAECVPKQDSGSCTRAECELPCEPDIGPDGCYSVCACPKTCKDIKCNADQDCKIQEIFCFRAPCFPIPTCVSKTS